MTETHFKEGIDAFERGLLHSACPYQYGSPAHTEWGEGWKAGLKARRGDEAAKNAQPQEIDKNTADTAEGLDAEDRSVLSKPKAW